MPWHHLELFTPDSHFWRYRLEIGLTVLGCILLMIGASGVAMLVRSFETRFYPDTFVDQISVTGLTLAQAREKLSTEAQLPEYRVKLVVGKYQIASSSAQLGLTRDREAALQIAFTQNHQRPLPLRIVQLLGWTSYKTQVESQWQFDQLAVTQTVSLLQAQSAAQGEPPAAQLITTNKASSLKIYSGKLGESLNPAQAQALVNKMALPIQKDQVVIATDSAVVDLSSTLEKTGHQLTTDEMMQFQNRAQKLVGKIINFTGDDQQQTVTDTQLISWLAWPDGYQTDLIASLTKQWQSQMTRPPQNAVFDYDPSTLVVKNFTPPQDGLTLDTQATQQTLLADLAKLEQTDTKSLDEKLALTITQPTIPLSATNDLGINEVIGTGDSEYFHSIPSRIHNVQITSDRLNNQLVKPGAEFSFNQAIGDVSAETGYQPAYIIKDGATVLGDGGGVCQVSSTLFRALLDGGLKITRRLPHSYRVSYYELNRKPGFDATVYSGNVDLRFINDTGHYLLIHSQADSKNLYMKVQLYGTSDGRTTQITNYTTGPVIPAPPPVYTVDPTLPHGVTKQVDFAASGIKTSFTNVIKDKDGKTIREDTYTSNYIPWSAKYLVGP